MKQLLQNMRSGQTQVVDVPLPSPRPKTALVHNMASLVSAGTERMLVDFASKSMVGKARSRPDLVRQVIDKARREGILTTFESVTNRLDQPMSLGYSSAGVIVAVGEGLQGYHVGDRVVCAGGGYAVHAEYAIVPQNLLASLPDGVDFEAGAFATLGAIAMHGFRLGMPQIGERVAVIGLGLLGLLAVEIAKAAGCKVFGVDLDPRRVELGRKLGIEAALRPEAEEACKAFTRGAGCDVVLICADTTSDDPVQLAGALARDRARVVAVGAFGMDIPRKIYYEKELTFLVSRSYGPGRYDPAYEEGGQDYPAGYVRWTEGRNLQSFADLLAGGCIDVALLITHRFPIENAAQAYDLITGKSGEPFLGVLITYPQEETELPTKETPPVSAPAPVVQPERVAWGVIGSGNYANAVFLPNLKRLPADRIGIVSASGISARHAAARYRFGYASSSDDQILDDPRVNAVAVLTRHHLHAPLIVRALQAGKHVFCEKPLALDMDELSEVLNALEDRPLLLGLGFNRRFAPMAIKLKEFTGKSREPLLAHYRVNAGFLPSNHWLHDLQQGGGRIIGESCHFVDFLTYLMGCLPVSVSAQALPDNGQYHEDNLVMTFVFENGSIGTVSYLANGDKSFPKERLEVFTGGRVAVLDDFRTLQLNHAGNIQTIRSLLRQDKGHYAALEAFCRAVTGGGAPPIPYRELAAVTVATFAAVESLRTGCRVEIPALLP